MSLSIHKDLGILWLKLKQNQSPQINVQMMLRMSIIRYNVVLPECT